MKAPKVRPCTRINHPNVFGEYICLDILTMSEETETTPYRGWSSAYTVSSLLVQLQCFLFDLSNNDKKYYESKAQFDRVYSSALGFKCRKCGHCGDSPQPPIVVAKREPGFYRTRSDALVRKGVSLKSPHVCDIPEGDCVLVTNFEGRRARLNLGRGKVGYCSVFTKQGVLLENVCGNLGAGVYKANKSVEVVRKDATGVFRLHKDEQITVAYMRPAGPQILAKISQIPRRYRSTGPMGIDMNNLYVDAEAIRMVEKEDGVVKKEIVLSGESYWLQEFYGEVLDIILSMVDADTAMKVSLCHEDLKIKVENSKILVKSQYRCFYTLKSMRDDDAVIGFGIKCEVMPKYSRHETFRGRNGRVMNVKRDVLQRLHPSFDFMTHEAFSVHRVKTNVWKDVVFVAFLPLYIDSTHGKKALPLAEKCILNMWKKENKDNKLNCERLMETLAKLMNTTIVNMNKCVEDLEVEELQLFDSIKAIEGYMAFHHLLLAFAVKYPKLCDIASEKIKSFCTNSAARDKEITPDIGELIVYLSISRYSWRRFYPSLAREVFDRNARWILAKYPGLRESGHDKTRSCIRLTQSFLATKTGKRLAAFQCFFMNEIACPVELQGNDDKVKILFNEYNARLGKPVAGLAERLQVHSRKVLAMSNWFDYFTLVGFSAPSSVQLSDWLRQSISRSALKRYHDVSQILKFSESHIESPNYVLHKNHFNCMCAGGQVFNLQDASSMETCTLVSKPKERIDIAFVIDCTGSMGSWISQAKKAIQQIVSDVNRKTQFKVVRFALVPYRDHSPGEGPNGYAVKKFDFTSNVQSMQKNVDTLSAGGGADAPEAMSCGFATAAGLSWNRDAMQLIIHIGDEKPHGISTDGYDNYPDGCPDGHDALRVAHNLAKKGIPIYNVYCGYGSSLTETFYHALSHITGGQCLRLQNASTLSDIVLGAAMEEQTMNRISQKIAPIWDRVHERHPFARDDQIIYELYQRLKADKFKVKCVLGGRQLCKEAMKSIETIAFCMDIKQVKAMQEQGGEYFYSFSKGDGQITKESTKLIDEGQVRKWYKRNKEIMAIAKFKQEGCMYAQPQWQNEAAEERRKDRSLARFGKRKPWEKTDRRTVLKTFDEAGKLASDDRSGTALIPSSGSVVKAPKVSAWTKPTAAKVEPSRNLPARQPVQPRNVPARQPIQPRNARAVNESATSAALARPMSRNTSYPVNPIPNSRSSSRSSNPNFPGRGMPIQSIRTKSRSNSASRRGAPIQSIRRSRSNSREPTRPQAAPVPVTSAAPQRTANAWTNSSSMPISRPPTSAACGCCAPTSSRSSSGSSEKPYARSLVVTFDTNRIIKDFLNSRFQSAGVLP